MLCGAPQLPKKSTRNKSWQRYWFLWAVWVICPPERNLPSDQKKRRICSKTINQPWCPQVFRRKDLLQLGKLSRICKRGRGEFFYNFITGVQSWTSHQPPSPRNAQREESLVGSPQIHLLTVWHRWVFCALPGGEDYHFKCLQQMVKGAGSLLWAAMFTKFVFSDYLKSRLHLEHRVTPL